LPLPEGVHVPPPAPTHVQVAVNEAGNVSATVAPFAANGPAFDAVIVYVTLPPAVTTMTPSVLVIARSAVGSDTGSLSVALLLDGSGSFTPAGGVTVAVLASGDDADGLTVAESVYVTLAPAGRFTRSLMSPVPDAVQVPPFAPTHVQDAASSDAGSVSTTCAAVAGSGPALLATMVYVTGVPATRFDTPFDLVIARLATRLVMVYVADDGGVFCTTPPLVPCPVAVFTCGEPGAPTAVTGPTTQEVAPPTGSGSMNVHDAVLTSGSVTPIDVSGTFDVLTSVKR
jgi:hypothetical protein